jgi:DNA-binding FadR family transcriptional regulator
VERAGPARMSRSEALTAQLEREILDERLPAGTRLGTKATLRTRYGVALATVNEAVRLLEMRGLVQARPGPGGGVFVGAPSPVVRLSRLTLAVDANTPIVAQAMTVRCALEEPVALEAAEHHRARDVRGLQRLLQAMTDSAGDPLRFMQANWALHRRIAELGRNDLLRTLYLALLDLVEGHVGGVSADPRFRASQNVELHLALVEAIASRDPERVRAAVAAHDPLTRLTATATNTHNH